MPWTAPPGARELMDVGAAKAPDSKEPNSSRSARRSVSSIAKVILSPALSQHATYWLARSMTALEVKRTRFAHDEYFRPHQSSARKCKTAALGRAAVGL